jgi:hypothetical protein
MVPASAPTQQPSPHPTPHPTPQPTPHPTSLPTPRALIVYGCEANLLSQAPGGRDNAKMIPKSYFMSLMLPHADDNYFLRPDRILAVFIIIGNKVQKQTKLSNLSRRDDIETEIHKETQVRECIDDVAGESDAFARDMFEASRHFSNGRSDNDDENIVEEEGNTSPATESDLLKMGDFYKEDSDYLVGGHTAAIIDGDGGGDTKEEINTPKIIR